MKILRLHIDHFGKFSDRTIRFSDGINIISGENESGKSTLHSFIGAMLLGLERGRGRAARNDAFTLYRPWNGGTCGGSITIEQDGHTYAITRDFGPKNPSLTIYDETEGRDLAPTRENLDRITLGLTPSLFRNTISVGQLSAGTGGELAAELRSHIVNLKNSGDYSLDIDGAVKTLTAKKRRTSASYDKDAETLSGELSEKAASLQRQLAAYPADGGLSEFQKKKKETEEQVIWLEERLEHNSDDRKRLLSGHGFASKAAAAVLYLLLALCFAAALGYCGWRIWGLAARGGGDLMLRILPFGAGALVSLVALIVSLRSFSHSRKYRALNLSLAAEKESLTAELSDLRAKSVRISDEGNLRERQSWERDRLEDELTDVMERRAALSASLEKNRHIRSECEALDLAIQTMQDISASDFSGFGKYLEKLSSLLIHSVTGSYTGLYISDEMDICLLQGDRRIPLSSVSTGTLDQVYLAVRLACVGFFWEQEDLPLLLDDTFAMYDDSRLERTLCWLLEIYSGQIFIFSCHSRELRILQSLSLPHTVLKL